MARTAPSPELSDRIPDGGPQPWLALLHTVGAVVGVGMAVLVGNQLAGLGPGLAAGSPLVHDVLALEGAASVAGKGALSLALLALATVAAAALLAGTAAVLWADHRRTAHRLTTFGLWVAITVCLAAMLPGVGYPFGAPSPSVPGGFEWHPAPKALAIAAAAGLLLSSITSRRERAAAAAQS